VSAIRHYVAGAVVLVAAAAGRAPSQALPVQRGGAQVATKVSKPVAVISGPTPCGGEVHGRAGTISLSGDGSRPLVAGHALTFKWSFGDDNSTATTSNATHAFSKVGHWPVTLVVVDGATASDPCTITWIVPPVPPTPVIDGPKVAEVGKPVTFSATRSTSNPPGHPLIFSWDFADRQRDAGATVTHTFKVASTYLVTMIAQDEGVQSGPAQLYVTVKAPSAATNDSIVLKTKKP